MRQFLTVLGLVAAWMWGAAAVQAADMLVLDCKTTSTVVNAALQPRMVLSYDRAKNTLLVADGLIFSLNGDKPLAGRVVSENDTRIDFSWQVKNVRNVTGQISTLNFKIVYMKATSKYTVQMIPQGYDNIFRDQGVCTVE